MEEPALPTDLREEVNDGDGTFISGYDERSDDFATFFSKDYEGKLFRHHTESVYPASRCSNISFVKSSDMCEV